MPGQGTGSSHETRHHGSSVGSHGQPAPAVDPYKIRDVQRENLLLLHRHGVRLAIGSDHADTSLAEAFNLHAVGIFDNLTLLNLWCHDTPRALYPGRRVGRLDEGYEASFLVLAGDPIADFAQVRTIRARFKQGRLLAVPNQKNTDAFSSRE
jgi:imidazolonepropionase-like amidohydrolase